MSVIVETKVDKWGRILLPKEVREVMEIKPGDKFKIIAEKDRIILLKISEKSVGK